MASGKIVGAAVSTVVLVAACGWGAWYSMLSEGSLPPESAMPEVPAGVTVVERGEECGSGGCWRVMTLRPAAGQTPQELAAAMGLTGERGLVRVGADVRGDLLVVHAGYQ